jgi:hypothetical protein
VPPRVQAGAAEVELAAGTILLRGNRSLGGQPAKRVAMYAQVLGGMARVEPLVRRVVRYHQPLRDDCGQAVGDVIQQLVEDRGLSQDCGRDSACTAGCLIGDRLSDREL